MTTAATPKSRADTNLVRVLVVDDDERNLRAIASVLEDVAEIVTARSGEDALRHLLRDEFAVILLDVYMPGLDGYETAALIRTREQTRRVPIVFLSAVNKEVEHLLRGYSMGAVDYVFKPVDPTMLRSKVAVFVDLYAMRKEIERNAREQQRLLDENLRANTERFRAEQQLRVTEQRQAAIIASLPITLYLEGIDEAPRTLKYASENFVTLTGFTPDQIGNSAETWAERLHPEDRERAVSALSARRDSGTHSVEYRWRCANGQYRHFLDHSVLICDADGAPAEYAGTLLDVSDRRELESQLNQIRKMDAIGQLTGGIAHDFNNLLAAVLGGMSMIERRITLDEEQKRLVDMIRHAAEQGAGLVRHLLAFSRRQKLEPAAVNVAALADTVGRLLAHTLGGRVELAWKLADDAYAVFADYGQLELAIMNLVINARDAMPDGGTVTVDVHNHVVETRQDVAGVHLAAGRYVILSVSDTGCGIAPERIEQVMEPFFTTKPVGKGTGLGLSMVYGFVKQSGGAIRLTSALGVGTCVELWLPAAAAEALAPAAEPAVPVAVEEAARSNLRILLVDDHDGARAATAAMLQDLGHHVSEACEGSAALELFREQPEAFDVVLSDYAMPRMSGAEVVRELRLLRPALPAIIITGYAEPNADLMRGQVPVLVKPFSAAALGAAVEEAGKRRL
ncbi:response regulator [Sphingomonas quercus]|uniref:histidine kinase n=1 Tax=Sphingomonas quercus TaxID=2842451 RepID=A0ABS6BGY6_9SPHN|nr:response regulator [Sphingomonas quercus]MBU3077568.1 response regulator [Sphingomonas quercus]